MADNHKNIFHALKLSEHKLEIKESKQFGYVKWGKKNDWPDYLLSLYEGHSGHGGIIKRKARYLSGKKITASLQNPSVDAILTKINPKESAHQLRKKTDKDQTIYNGFAVKIVPNPLGQPISAYHMDFGKIRPSICGTKIYYSEDWSDNNTVPVVYPIWAPGMKEAGVYLYRAYNPSVKKLEAMFPKPEYVQCVVDIDTDKRVSTFFNALVQNGFSAGTIVTIYENPTDQNQKDFIVESMTDDHAGEENAGKVVVMFTDRNGKGAEVVRLNADDLDKQYQEVSKRNRENIMMGHAVPPVLFGPQTDGKLGQRTEIDLAQELFINDYAEIEQQPFHEFLTAFTKAKTGVDATFETEQIDLVGIDFMNPIVQAVMTKNEIREKLGMQPLPDGNATPGAEWSAGGAMVNQNLKSLSGRENQNLQRIIRQYDKGTLPKARALHMLTSGYGMTMIEAEQFLNIADEGGEEVQMSRHKNREEFFFTLLEKYAHDVQDDEVIDVIMKSEAFTEGSVTEIRNAVLQLIKGNPEITTEGIAKALGIEASEVSDILKWLQSKKLVEGSIGYLTPTKKAFNKDTDVETVIYTEYRYKLRDDLASKGESTIIPTSRKFCRDMVAKTKTKALTYEAITKLSNEFGENAWDFRGGFYGDEPWCRHIWEGETKIKRIRK